MRIDRQVRNALIAILNKQLFNNKKESNTRINRNCEEFKVCSNLAQLQNILTAVTGGLTSKGQKVKNAISHPSDGTTIGC